jgi:hypothetical protein
MTARNFEVNGFDWTGVTSYRAHSSRLTPIATTASTLSTRSTDTVSEADGLGFSGTNAGGELYLINSVYQDNMGAVVPNSLDGELLPPQREDHIAGNLVIDNNKADAPTKGLARLAWGEGIALASDIADTDLRRDILFHLHQTQDRTLAPLVDHSRRSNGLGNRDGCGATRQRCGLKVSRLRRASGPTQTVRPHLQSGEFRRWTTPPGGSKKPQVPTPAPESE